MILTQPVTGLTNVPGTSGVHLQIPPSANVDVDSYPVLYTRAMKWLLSIQHVNGSKHHFEEIAAMVINGQVRFTSYGRMGDIIDSIIDARIDGSNIVLNITNNENYTLDVCFTRIQVFG